MTITIAEPTDKALRPRTFDEYIGQERLKHRLQVIVDGALVRAEPLPPMLFLGPPGVGKTSLAAVVAGMVGDNFLERRGALDRKALLNALWSINGLGTVMLDEIHCWRAREQEILLPLIEDGFVDTPGGRAEFPCITVIAGTTERGKLIEPLQERFGVPFEFEPYTYVELGTMVLNMADRLGVKVSTDDAVDMAIASAGSTRTLRYLLMTYRNLEAHLRRAPSVAEILEHTAISADGLTRPHREFLAALERLGGNGGKDRVAAMMRMDPAAVVRTSYLLIDRGYVIPGSGSQGLILTIEGRKRLAQEGA